MPGSQPATKANNFPSHLFVGVAIPRQHPATLWFFDQRGRGYPFGTFISNEGSLVIYQKQTMSQFQKDNRRYSFIGRVPEVYPQPPTFKGKDNNNG